VVASLCCLPFQAAQPAPARARPLEAWREVQVVLVIGLPLSQLLSFAAETLAVASRLLLCLARMNAAQENLVALSLKPCSHPPQHGLQIFLQI